MSSIKEYPSTSPLYCNYKRCKKEIPIILSPLSIDDSDVDDALPVKKTPMIFTFSKNHQRLSKINQLCRSRPSSNK